MRNPPSVTPELRLAARVLTSLHQFTRRVPRTTAPSTVFWRSFMKKMLLAAKSHLPPWFENAASAHYLP